MHLRGVGCRSRNESEASYDGTSTRSSLFQLHSQHEKVNISNIGSTLTSFSFVDQLLNLTGGGFASEKTREFV
jgi:hypothetical protein